MTDQWDEKARVMCDDFSTCGVDDIAAALRAAYARGVEDSAELTDKFDGAVAFTDQLEIARAVILRDTEIIARIRALKRGGK